MHSVNKSHLVMVKAEMGLLKRQIQNPSLNQNQNQNRKARENQNQNLMMMTMMKMTMMKMTMGQRALRMTWMVTVMSSRALMVIIFSMHRFPRLLWHLRSHLKPCSRKNVGKITDICFLIRERWCFNPWVTIR